MKNNPLNGHQPDDELVAVADAQEHEIEHVQKPAANAAQSPETDAATVDPDTGEIIDTTDGAAAAMPATGSGQAVSTDTQRSRERRAKNDFYNLTVEIPRDVAERVFSPDALRKLGYLSKSDFVRHAVAELDAKLSTITAKEKAADAGTSDGKAD